MKTATSILVVCVAALLALGMVMLYSSSMADKGGGHLLQMQIVWCSLGLLGCSVAASIDYRKLKIFALPLFVLAVALLVLVMLPHFGSKVNGARRWFRVGGVQFQPSELAKLALIIAVAWYGDQFQRKLGDFKRGLVFPALLIGTVLGLIFIEPDRGTTILMAAVSAGMLFVAGARWKYVVPPVILGAAGLAFSLLYDPMRTKRIFAWLHTDEHKMDTGYQAYQAMLALGAGGWTGLGLGNSREKLGFLPEHNTDFIFSIIGEELGLVATLLVVVAFVLLVICGIYISSHASDNFGTLLGCGVTFLIGLQAFINIGVVTSALPNKGLPLPFISYGGSNLLMMLTAVGLLLSIARRARVAPAVATSMEHDEVPQTA
ncbi:MAG TPA: putative lipid II flippase FtsW [Verrucomicrobiae bacterium]|nr:putative lipid II flippase FtsW [Verrucomicrobiae bacterium]